MNNYLRALLLGTLLLAWTPPGEADQNDQRLNELFALLQTDVNERQAGEAVMQIWNIWIDSGREDVNELMDRGMQAMTYNRLDEAVEIFTRIVKLAPEFAEGWNKRATVYYLRGELAESVYDIERTLALEPRHFGAISGMGLIFLRRGDESGALNAFEEVLKLNPHAEGTRLRVESLRKRVQGSGV